MRALSATLVGASVVLVCTTSALVVRIWLLRHSFEMAARSPVLLIFVGVASLIMAVLVLLNWFLLLEGQGLGLPCYATYIGTYYWYAFGVVPYLLRGVRIVVVYHSSYRYKYAGLVKWRNLRKAWASTAVSIVVLAMIYFAVSASHYSNNYGCGLFDETVLLGVVMLTAGPGFLFLLYKFSQVNDAFKLRLEFISVFSVVSLDAAVILLIQGLYKSGAIAESRTAHLIMEITTLVNYLNNLFRMLLVSVAMYDGWCGFGVSRVTPTEDYTVSTGPKSSGRTHDGVLGYVEEGGRVASMFEHFCARNLCAENWDFIIAVCKYQTASGVEEQFNTFVHIMEQYLQPTSPQEVNISSRMQAKLASVQDKEKFSALNEESRSNVLQEPLKEIVRVIEQNLLVKFKQSPEMLKWRENQRLQNLLIEQANSAAAEGDENMREQLLLCSNFISEDGMDEARS